MEERSLMKRRRAARAEANGGFAVVDDKGRLSLPRPVRRALGLDADASVAWIAVGGAVLLVPQDQHLSNLAARAQAALAAAGLSVDDVLAELPAARAEVVEETYGPDLVREIERAHAAAHRSDAAE
jgi:bifunctional DNA-binding transcriptional regulator/antitoxin component of YhaV-PrlF toxin-antitoxin module